MSHRALCVELREVSSLELRFKIQSVCRSHFYSRVSMSRLALARKLGDFGGNASAKLRSTGGLSSLLVLLTATGHGLDFTVAAGTWQLAIGLAAMELIELALVFISFNVTLGRAARSWGQLCIEFWLCGVLSGVVLSG